MESPTVRALKPQVMQLRMRGAQIELIMSQVYIAIARATCMLAAEMEYMFGTHQASFWAKSSPTALQQTSSLLGTEE